MGYNHTFQPVFTELATGNVTEEQPPIPLPPQPGHSVPTPTPTTEKPPVRVVVKTDPIEGLGTSNELPEGSVEQDDLEEDIPQRTNLHTPGR